MTNFTFNTAFRNDLKDHAHHYGEVSFLESLLRPGMTVIEGGANRGVTTIAIAKAIGEEGVVHAFEPVQEFHKTLKENLSINNIKNTNTYNLALSNKNGSIQFYKHGEGSGVTLTDDAEKTNVEAITLTSFCTKYNIKKIDFINFDCEGSELLIFQEAQALLKKQMPPIFCEIHRSYLETLNQSVPDLVKFLENIGYRVQPIQVEDLNGNSDFEQCSHIYASENIKQ